MQISDFNKQITSTMLNESLARQFGQRIDLNKFTLEQLLDARNKMRTKISQLETSSGFNAVNENEEFQKTRLFLDVINTAISERESLKEEQKISFTKMEEMVLRKVREGLIEFAELPNDLQEKAKLFVRTRNKNIKESYDNVPEDDVQALAQRLANGDITLSEFHAELDALANTENAPVDDTDESNSEEQTEESFETTLEAICFENYQARKQALLSEGLIFEGEEEKAALIMSSRDMVDRITGWMEDTANMQAESMLELVDAIRDELGQDIAAQFDGVVKPALQAVYKGLETARQQLTTGVTILTGEGGETMGAEPADTSGQVVGGEEAPEVAPTAEEPSEDNPFGGGDEFGAGGAAAGGEEPAGRAQRESVDYNARLKSLLTKKK